MIAPDCNWPPFRSHAVRLLQVATPARSRNPGSAASGQCPKAARATSIAFALGRPCSVHLAVVPENVIRRDSRGEGESEHHHDNSFRTAFGKDRWFLMLPS